MYGTLGCSRWDPFHVKPRRFGVTPDYDSDGPGLCLRPAGGVRGSVRVCAIQTEIAAAPNPRGTPAGLSWSRKSEQRDKWSFCLTAGKIDPRIRRDDEQTSTAEPHSGFQGEGGACRRQE
jgi:hypothetical protein